MSNLKIALFTALAFILLEGLIFRSGLYSRYLEPSSSTGIFERTIRDEKKRTPLGPDEVLVVGDSRIGEGFSAKIANAASPGRGYFFANVAVAGSTPRSWYYLLRDLDPTRSRYRAIVLAVESFDDIDRPEDLRDRLLDLHYCIMRLRYRDAYEFAFSFHTPRKRLEALRGIFLKGVVLQSDLLAFFEDMHKRLIRVEEVRKHAWEWSNGYGGNPGDLAQLQVDWAQKTIHFPEALYPLQRDALQHRLLGPFARQDGTLGRYHEQWFGKILDLYRDSDTPLVFLPLPSGPAAPPHPLIQPVSHVIRDLAKEPGVILLPEGSFASLEKGDFYFDSLHLNARGRVQFSTMLAHLMRLTLGPSRN